MAHEIFEELELLVEQFDCPASPLCYAPEQIQFQASHLQVLAGRRFPAPTANYGL